MRPTDLDRSEIMMYMGTAQLDSSLSQMLDKCVCELCQTAQPRTVCGLFDVEHTPKGVTVGGLPLEGKDIALHLEGCKKAVIMAATLSASVDTLIRRAQYVDMTKALMYDAAAGAVGHAYEIRRKILEVVKGIVDAFDGYVWPWREDLKGEHGSFFKQPDCSHLLHLALNTIIS